MENDLLSLSYLIDAISSLPGVGKKSAKKIAYFLINQDEYYLNKFIDILKNAKNDLFLCTSCNNLTSNKNHICYICTDLSDFCAAAHSILTAHQFFLTQPLSNCGHTITCHR